MADILVVDDDHAIATAFERFLSVEGHRYRLASNAADAIRLVGEQRPDLVLMDIRMPGVDGLHALQRIRGLYPDLQVVIMTAYGTSQTSIDAIRGGAFDYLTKPLDLDALRAVIDKAIVSDRLSDPASEAGAGTEVALVGDSPAMVEVYRMIGRLTTNDVPALVVGERGTGKRLVIATIHDNSARVDRPFVSVQCGDVSEARFEETLLDSRAGTVHLEHVELLPPALQGRVARALEDGTRGDRRPSARILASTEIDLAERVREGAFNRATYDVLSVITVRLPPLRERLGDIPQLVQHFIRRCNAELNRTIKRVDDAAAGRLREHAWPGNVGELERFIKRACIVARGDVITTDEIGESFDRVWTAPTGSDADSALGRAARAALRERLVGPGVPEHASTFHDVVDVVESALVSEALAMTNGNQVRAAEILGVNRATLRKKMPSAG